MDLDWTMHPWAVILFGMMATGAVEATRRVAKLFGKVDRLEAKVDEVDRKVEHVDSSVQSLAADLRQHMDDEGDTVARLDGKLETVIQLMRGGDK